MARFGNWCLILLCSGLLTGCNDKATSSAPAAGAAATSGPAATNPTTAPAWLVREDLGVALSFPPGWTPKPDNEYVLVLVGSSPERTISLDVPSLPAHIPGMIPMGLVKNGFLDDLRKLHGTIDVTEDSQPQVPRATARMVQCTWQDNGKGCWQRALLLVHSDRVYIVRGTSDAAGETETRAAFDAVIQSLRWTN